MNTHKLFNVFVIVAMLAMAVGMPVTVSAQSNVTECPDGMVGYWKFDEESGTMACDSINDYDGTVYEATWSTGIVGNALDFDGVDDYVAFSTHDFVNTSENFSYAVWVKFNEDINGNCTGPTYEYDQMIASIHDGPYLYLGTSGRMVTMTIQPDNTWKILKTNRCSWSKNTWYHIAVTFDNTNMRIYVDGSLENEISGGFKKSSGDSFHLMLGKMHYLDDYYFSGSMDEFGVFNSALSAEEVQQYYQNGLSGQPYCIQAPDNTYSPSFSARITENQVHGYGWLLGSDVMLSIDGVEIDTQTVAIPDWDPNGTFVGFDLGESLTLQAGQVIEMTDGTITKTHTVTNLEVTGIDPGADTVSGTATYDTQVDIGHIYCDENGCYGYRRVLANSNNEWLANFSVAGEDDDEQDIIDITPGMGNEARQCDEDGDCTTYGWYVPNPTFGVRVNTDQIEGWEWHLGTTENPSIVTIEIDDPGTTAPEQTPDFTGYATVSLADWNPNQTYFSLNIENYDLKTGDFVTVTDGNITKHLNVTLFEITDFNLDTEMVYGVAGENQHVNIWTWWQNDPCINRDETAESTGDWETDFSVPGEQDWENETADLRAGSWIDSSVNDEDGDQIMFGVNVPNPTFQVQPGNNHVGGWEWPQGETVTVEIDDPETTEVAPDYTDYATVEVADWDPNQTWFDLDLQGSYDLKIGDLVTVSHGTTVKTLTVAPLEITDVDIDLDTVSGKTNPGADINVWVHGENSPNINLTADVSTGEWTADFTGQWDIGFNTNGAAAQNDEDGDQTWVGWEITRPRIEVSYEHDWIQINGFTAGGDVTYTIYDYEGGHALFGPVTGPVDSHGQGWISSNLHHTDLIPGNYITAVNEATGEEVSILIRNVNLDYIGVEDDRVFGTAEPNTTIELNIGETHDQGFNLMVDVNISGYWEVNLAAQGHLIDSYRYADARLYDAEGDSIIAQSPWIDAQISTDNFGVTNFSKNADVTLTLYDSFGGDVLYGPVTLRTDGSGGTWVNLWDHGIDLVPGNYITAYDHSLGFNKSLEVEPFDFQELNVADDYVSGSAAVGEWVDLHVESLFSNWGLDALTSNNGQWFRDYGVENYDITDQMWANGWAVDNRGNRSHDHTTGLPNIEASIADDWISGFNFSPDREVRIQIYDTEGGSLLANAVVIANGNTQFNANYWQHEVDLQAGMYLFVEDLETGKTAELTLVHLTFDGVNYDLETAWGQADEGTQVVVRANHIFDNYEVTVIADESGDWLADFSDYGADLNPEWNLRAMVFDLEYDATVADAPRPPEFTTSLTRDWVSGNNWTPVSTVNINVYDNGENVWSGTWNTDNYGNFHANLDVDLLSGFYVTVLDNSSGAIKSLSLANLTIDYLDADLDVAGGQAPAETRLSVDFNNQQENIQFDLFSESDSTWQADFGAHDFDLQLGSSGSIIIFDDDGDGTQVEGYVPNPHFTVYPEWEAVEARDWPDDILVSASVDGKSECTAEGLSGYPEWDPSTTNVWMDFPEGCDVAVDDTVTVTDGVTQVSHVVQYLTVTEANAESDYVSGTAISGTVVYVWPHGYGEYEEQPIANDENIWQADFDFDLQPGIDGRSEVRDVNGNATAVDWHIPNPNFAVRVNQDMVEAYEWVLGASLILKVDDPNNGPGVDYNETQIVGVAPWDPNQTYVEFHIGEVYDIQPGYEVSLTDGFTTKTHTVKALEITDFDIEHDLVYGTAAPNSVIDQVVACNNEYCAPRQVNVDSEGDWMADFGNPGDGEPGTYDIVNGTWLDAQQGDEDGDFTFFGVSVPKPIISVRLDGNTVTGYEWPSETDITLTINGDYFATGQMAEAPWGGETIVYFELNDLYTVKPGDIVTLQGGGFTSSHTVFDGLSFVFANIDTETITGTASIDASIQVNQCDDNNCADRYIEGTTEETWTVDFSVEGPRDDEKVLRDLQSGMSGEIWQFDEWGNSTVRSWNIPNPSITVYSDDDVIEGNEWPLDATLTVQIGSPDQPDYTTTTTLNPADQDHTLPWFKLELSNNYDLQPGETVTVFDEGTTKQVIVVNRNITLIDPLTDIITGSADPTIAFVVLWACNDNDCAARRKDVNPDGSWSVNFAEPGELPWENIIVDIKPDTTGGIYQSDNDGDGTIYNWLLNQPPVADAGSDRDAYEGDTITLDASASSDPEAGALTYEWDLDNDGEYDDASGVTTDVTYPDNGVFTYGLRVTDNGGLTAEDTVTITVQNVAPTIESFTAPEVPVQRGIVVNMSAGFSDPGIEDTFTATWNWEDGTISEGVIADHTVSGSHLYTVSGVYTVRLTITDDDGGTTTYIHQYVVIFDPDGGFVTGGGWFTDPATSDKANFGFNTKYNMDAKIPFGNTNFKLDDLHFTSTSYDWLVVSGARAQYKGTGTINGAGEYGFFVTVIDGKIVGDSVDYFRIKIWDIATGSPIYDNHPDVPDNADPFIPITSGSIVIHK